MHSSVLNIILNKKLFRDCQSPAVKPGFHVYSCSHTEHGFKTTIEETVAYPLLMSDY